MTKFKLPFQSWPQIIMHKPVQVEVAVTFSSTMPHLREGLTFAIEATAQYKLTTTCHSPPPLNRNSSFVRSFKAPETALYHTVVDASPSPPDVETVEESRVVMKDKMHARTLTHKIKMMGKKEGVECNDESAIGQRLHTHT